MAKVVFLAAMLASASLLAACNGSEIPTVTPTIAAIATPDTDIAPPPLPGAEGPLYGGMVEIPEIWIVPSLVSKEDLALYLKTTVEQLDWVNPGLEQRVVPGALIAIPASYRVSTEETLAAISAATGLPEELLRTANPNLSAAGPLPVGTVLAVPPITIMAEATSLSATAAALNLSGSALLSVNPELAGRETIDAGTVLILPIEDGAP